MSPNHNDDDEYNDEKHDDQNKPHQQCPLHAYKHMFGAPNTGVHEQRIGDFALNDILLTIVLAIICKGMFSSSISLLTWIIFWFVVGFVLHIAFGVDTAMVRYVRRVCDEQQPQTESH